MSQIKTLLARTALATVIVAGSAAMAQAQMVYHRGNTADPETLDQHKTSTIYESNILRDLYEGLVAHDAAAEVVPGAAESWEISDDGTVYTFHLREDARWSNGDPVTAEDFVYSFRRIQDPATGAKYATILYPIKNAEAINTGEITDFSQLGVRAVDERTLEITLQQPTPYFLELLTHQTGLPVHPASVEEHGNDFVQPENMVSNGAYRLVEVIPNAHIKLEKNPEYWRADEVAIDEVYFYPTEDRAAALRQMRAGELHSNNDIPFDQIDWIEQNMPEILRISPYLGTYYYTVNTAKEPFSDVRVRQALSMAIYREPIVQEIWGAGEIPAYSMVPPGMGDYEQALPEWAGLGYEERVEMAQELLTEAGYGPDNPISLTIRYNTSENHEKTAVAIAAMWEPLGVNVELFNSDTATHYAVLRDKEDYDVARAGWIADYKDPQNFLFLLESNNPGFNYANWENEEYDRLMREAAATTGDPAARMELLHQAEEIFVEEQPYFPIYFYTTPNMVSATVEGWVDNVVNVHPTQYMRIVEAQ